MAKTALLIIDVQNDFVSGGTLCVPDGDAVIPVCNALREGFHWDTVVLTQDWHPPNHLSFHDNYTPVLEHFSKRSVTLDSGPMSGTTFTQVRACTGRNSLPFLFLPPPFFCNSRGAAHWPPPGLLLRSPARPSSYQPTNSPLFSPFSYFCRLRLCGLATA